MEKIDGLGIRARRLRTDLKQYELASNLSISQTRLSDIECGRLQPGPGLLERILEALKREQRAK